MNAVIDRPRLRATMYLALLAIASFLAWTLRNELLLVFAAALFGTALYACSAWLARHTPVSHRAAVSIWFATGILVALGGGWFIGHRVSNQYGSLTERIPEALQKIENRVSEVPVVGTLASDIAEFRMNNFAAAVNGGAGEGDGDGVSGDEGEGGGSAASGGMQLVRVTLSTVAGVTVWAVLAFYFAFDGQRYGRMFTRLVPPEHRQAGEELVAALGNALPYWLVGRLASMAVVAVLTGVGLMILGIPVAFTLAVIAGLFSFVPFLGPLASVVPGVLVTLQAKPQQLLWVLLVYGVVQFVESNILTPQIQQYTVSVPPVILIVTQVVAGTLLGIVGVMFATPLALAGMIVVQVVYLKHGLGETIETPRATA